MVFAVLAIAGYYVGAAVANDHNAANEPVGVMVVEEEYGMITVPEKQPATKDHHADKQEMMHQNHNSTGSNNGANNAGGVMVEEEISETEN